MDNGDEIGFKSDSIQTCSLKLSHQEYTGVSFTDERAYVAVET